VVVSTFVVIACLAEQGVAISGFEIATVAPLRRNDNIHHLITHLQVGLQPDMSP
jgi:hypothetical protein